MRRPIYGATGPAGATGVQGATGVAGVTGIQGATGPSGGGSSSPFTLLSQAQIAKICDAAGHTTLQGNYTLGGRFVPTIAGKSLAGFDFYWKPGTSKTIKCSLWDAAGTSLKTVNVAVTSANIYTATFASAQSLNPFAIYYVGYWTNDGSSTGYCVSRNDYVNSIDTVGPNITATNIGSAYQINTAAIQNYGVYAAGDAWPQNVDATFLPMLDLNFS